MTVISGVVQSVSAVTLGATLDAAAAAGATVLTLTDVSDFDGENGGTVQINGQLVTYSAVDVDDDTGAQTITLTAGLAADAAEDDRVDVWDTATAAPAVEYRALIELPESVDNADSVEAVVNIALVPLLPLGLRDPGTGETVTLDQQQGELVITDVRGKQPLFDAAIVKPGSIDVGALGFQVGSTTVTVAATAPTDPAPQVDDIWIDTTSGNQMNRWDGTAWVTFQFGTDAIAAGSVTTELLAANAVVAQNIAAGALDAVSVTALSVIAGSLSSGNIGSSVLDSSDITDTRYVLVPDDTRGAILIYAVSGQTSETLSTPGVGSWTVPAGVTSVKVECTGGGGSGAGSLANGFGVQGGGGGEYARENGYAVTPAASIPYTVGAGGAGVSGGAGLDGGDTSFDNTVTAHGGVGGGQFYNFDSAPGGAGSTSSVHFTGGTGHNGGLTTGTGGGGGGSAGGSAKVGGDGHAWSGATGGAGGTAPAGAGAGGKGGNAGGAGQTGTAGSAPGGGGGGAGPGTSARAGGAGAAGRIKLTYGGTFTLVASIAGAAGIDQFGTAYPAGVWIAPITVAATSAMTAAAGQSITSGSFARTGNVCQMAVNITLPAITGNASGNIGNTQVGQVTDARFIPVLSAPVSGGASGPVLSAYVDNTGAVFVTALPPNYTVTSGDPQTLLATYVTASNT